MRFLKLSVVSMALWALCLSGCGGGGDKNDPILGSWQMGKHTIDIKKDGTWSHTKRKGKGHKERIAACKKAGKDLGPEPQATWTTNASGTYSLKEASLRTQYHKTNPCSWNIKAVTGRIDGGKLLIKAGSRELTLNRAK